MEQTASPALTPEAAAATPDAATEAVNRLLARKQQAGTGMDGDPIRALEARTAELSRQLADLTRLVRQREEGLDDGRVQQALDALEQRREQLYQRFDLGEMPMAALRAAERQLDDRRDQLLEAVRRHNEAGDDGKPVDLAGETKRLQAENTWLAQLPQTTVDDILLPAAQASLERQGRLTGRKAADDLAIRQEIVRLGRQMGLDAAASPPRAAPGPDVARPEGAGAGPEAAHRRAKLALAAKHPPAVAEGGTAMPAEGLDRKALGELSDTDLADLPDDVLALLAGER